MGFARNESSRQRTVVRSTHKPSVVRSMLYDPVRDARDPPGRHTGIGTASPRCFLDVLDGSALDERQRLRRGSVEPLDRSCKEMLMACHLVLGRPAWNLLLLSADPTGTSTSACQDVLKRRSPKDQL